MRRQIELMENAEKAINEALRLALRERSATRSLEVFLQHLGETLHGDRIYICEGHKGDCVSNTYEWCAPNVTPEKENLQNVPYEAVKWWYDAFEKNTCIIIKDVEAIKETEPLTYEYLRPQNIHSLVASALVIEDTIIGFYGVDNPPEEIMDHVVDVAEIVGHFIASLLQKQKLMALLEKLSFEDSLSGARNRHALNDYISYHSLLRNVGIVYCDVLGLKKVNDTLGHVAGDELIIRASLCLQNEFRKTDIYRVGGDEFLVLCADIAQDVFEQKVQNLRKSMHENEAVMSLGSLWREVVLDVDALIAEADNLMYQEKRAYYASK